MQMWKIQYEEFFDRKIRKSTHSWSIYFWTPLENVSTTEHYQKTSTQNPKPRKKTLYSKRSNFIDQYNEVEKNLYPNSFTYVWTIFEQQQIQDMYASRKVQVSSILRTPKTHFRHVRIRQRGSAITSSINNIQNTNNRTHEVEHRETVNKKTRKKDYVAFSSNQRIISSLLEEKLDRKTRKHRKPICIRLKWLLVVHRIRVVIVHFFLKSFCSRCFKLRFGLVQYDLFLRFFIFRFCVHEIGPS